MKVVCLVSGGIDSPVASWLAIREGCDPTFVFYDNYPFTGESTKERALETIKKLKKYSSKNKFKIYLIPHGPNLVDILRNCPRELTCILCRRMMYRLAERVAEEEKADAIVTGEIIGEHASQTLRNIRVEDNAMKDICVLRPLIAMDKIEVERLARKIGTFQVSTQPALCCTAPPTSPRTRASLGEVNEAEKGLDINHMVKRDLKNATIVEI